VCEREIETDRKRKRKRARERERERELVQNLSFFETITSPGPSPNV